MIISPLEEEGKKEGGGVERGEKGRTGGERRSGRMGGEVERRRMGGEEERYKLTFVRIPLEYCDDERKASLLKRLNDTINVFRFWIRLNNWF